MIKGCKTVQQYKIMQYIQEHFCIDEFAIDLEAPEAVKITDKIGESLIFKYEDGEVKQE